MTVQWGDTGKVSIGTLKTFTINPIPFRETFLSSDPIILPTTEPTNGQVSYTVQNSDMPTVTPSPVAMGNAPIVHAAGKAITACTLSYKLLKNGSSVVTGTSAVTANNNWSYSFVNSSIINIQVGDVLELKLWSTQTDTQFDYNALVIYPTRICLSQQGVILKDLTFSPSVTHVLTQGRSPTANTNATQSVIIYGTTTTNIVGSATTTIPVITQGSTVVTTTSAMAGQLNVYYGDAGLRTSVSFRQNSTFHPYYERNTLPQTMSFREISL